MRVLCQALGEFPRQLQLLASPRVRAPRQSPHGMRGQAVARHLVPVKHLYIFSYLTQEHWGLHPSLAQCKEHPGSSLRDLSGFHQGKQLSGWESLTPSF